MIVIDTHALVWFAQGDTKLGERGRAAIDEALSSSGVFVPAIATWEVAVLVDRRRISLGMAPQRWFERVFDRPGMRLAPLDPDIGVDAGTLPGDIHGDPADRIIVATARKLDLPLLTVDRRILAYAAAGHVRAVDARG